MNKISSPNKSLDNRPLLDSYNLPLLKDSYKESFK